MMGLDDLTPEGQRTLREMLQTIADGQRAPMMVDQRAARLLLQAIPDASAQLAPPVYQPWRLQEQTDGRLWIVYVDTDGPNVVLAGFHPLVTQLLWAGLNLLAQGAPATTYFQVTGRALPPKPRPTGDGGHPTQAAALRSRHYWLEQVQRLLALVMDGHEWHDGQSGGPNLAGTFRHQPGQPDAPGRLA